MSLVVWVGRITNTKIHNNNYNKSRSLVNPYLATTKRTISIHDSSSPTADNCQQLNGSIKTPNKQSKQINHYNNSNNGYIIHNNKVVTKMRVAWRSRTSHLSSRCAGVNSPLPLCQWTPEVVNAKLVLYCVL